MAIRHKRKNISKTSQARARRQKKIERRKLLLENLEDRRLLAGIPQLAGIQTNDGELLDNGDVIHNAPSELVFRFNQAAEIDINTLAAIQVLQSGRDGTFDRASAVSDLNTGGDVQLLFTATAPGVAGNGRQVIFTKSDHGNASSPFVEVDVEAGTVTLDLNTHVSNPTNALGIANAINNDPAASTLLTVAIFSGEPLTDVASGDITYSPIVLAGSNDVVIDPGYVGRGDSAREIVFRFKETLADETYQVIIDGSSPLALKDIDGSVFQDGEDFTLQFELELGAQVTAVVPQPVIRDSAGALDQLRDTIHVYFNDDDLDLASAQNPAFYQLIYTRTTVDTGDDPPPFLPISVDYNAQADLAVLKFSAPLNQLIDPLSGTEIKYGTFRLRIGTDEAKPSIPVKLDLSLDAGSSFDTAQSVGHTLDVKVGGSGISDGQSFDIRDDQGVSRTFEFDKGDGNPLDPGATPPSVLVSITDSDTASQVAATITSAINSEVNFQVQATAEGSRISLLNISSIKHADIVITGDASTFEDGQTVDIVSDTGRLDKLEVETGFLLHVPGAGSDPNTEITDAQIFTISDGSSTVIFEFDLQGNGVATGNVAIGYAGSETAADMAEKVKFWINQSLEFDAQAVGGGTVYLGETGNITLVTDPSLTAVTQSGQPGVAAGNIKVVLVPSAAVTSDQVAGTFADAVNNANLEGVSAEKDGVRVFLNGVASVSPTSGMDGLLGPAKISISQFQSIILTGEIAPEIDPSFVTLPEVGSVAEPSHRDIRVQSHLNTPVDSIDGTNNRASLPDVQYYSFPEQYGTDPQGNTLLNAITEQQKQRAREIFEIYGQQLGITFVEHDTPGNAENDLGFKIVTGDMRAVDPNVQIGVGGVLGIAAGDIAIMDLQDFQSDDDDRYGGSWFRVAMHEIGHLLGLGHTHELPPITIMADDPALSLGQPAEPIYPGDHDLVHGRQLYRPDSNDIDLYRIPISSEGILSIETFAERQSDSSVLDTVVTLYREINGPNNQKVRELVARNDDYFSEDSRIELSLNAGIYYIGVSASGNDSYNPEIEDSGYGGTSQGRYELQLTFRPKPGTSNSIIDESGSVLDGDGDGSEGGVFNFWFQTAIPSGVIGSLTDEPRTLFVDKLAGEFQDGSLVGPFGTFGAAAAEADAGDIIRLVANPGADSDLATLTDNVAYQFGYNGINGSALEDGASLLVPQGVTVMIEPGVIIKSRRGRIGVGSSSPSIDRSGAALQVLGAPLLVDQASNPLLDATGETISGTVYFTSINDQDIGADSNPDQFPPAPRPGDWGGLDFRQEVDGNRVDAFLYSDQGVFLDYVNQASIFYGGGVVLIDGTAEVISPVHLTDARPTITFNTISQSAESAISANPDSFEETTFHERTRYQTDGVSFTSDYSRVGPAIHGNTVFENSINGLFVRIATPAGNETESLTVAGRFDDTDIVHVITENLKIEGTPGGPLLEISTPPTILVTLNPLTNGTLSGTYRYKIVFVDADGNEENPSAPTRPITLDAGSGGVRLNNLPPATAGYSGRRLYRSNSQSEESYQRIAELNATSSFYEDNGGTIGGTLDSAIDDPVRSRLDASLVIDPGMIVKLDGSRIDVEIGSQLIAEGVDGREVILTSLRNNRYGIGGTFDTSFQGEDISAENGDWSGILALPMSRVSIDHALVSYAGGVSRIEGTFAGFNSLEIHQAQARITNSVFQFNADGSGGQADPDRLGRGPNDESVIFVRGAQPVILNNVIRDNVSFDNNGNLADNGNAAAISIDVNSLNHVITPDLGQWNGVINRKAKLDGNQGALVRNNQLENNAINGMVVRGGTLTTEGVWDDTDIVHVLNDLVHITDFHTYGGLRLQSSGNESLVVKLEGDTAGFLANGRPLEIDDRVGGVIQVIGQPGYPVVITSLADDTVGAGYKPDGGPQIDTNNDGLIGDALVGQEGTKITINTSGASNNPALREKLDEAIEIWESVLLDPVSLSFDILVDSIASGAAGFMVSTATLGEVSYDLVRDAIIADSSADEFPLVNRLPDLSQLQTLGGTASGTIYLSQANAKALELDLDDINWNYPTDVNGDDICWTVDCDGAFTIDEDIDFDQQWVTNLVLHEIGHALGFISTLSLVSSDLSTLDLFRLEPGEGQIDFTNAERVMAEGIDAVFYDEVYDSAALTAPAGLTVGDIPMSTGEVNPPGDGYQPSHFKSSQLNGGTYIGVMDPTVHPGVLEIITDADRSVLGLIGWDVTKEAVQSPRPGDWNSIQIASFGHDRNIGVVVEREGVTDQNRDPETAQYLGVLAPHEKSGDDNQRLGFQVHGQILQPHDVDVYSFGAQGGTEVWLDIDATSHALDTVVELIDVAGNVLARSDNSIEEAANAALLFDVDPGDDSGVYPLEKSAHGIYDHWTTNPRDAGMRVVLPGSQGITNTYQVRVRSGNDNLSDDSAPGKTSGRYQLQIRLHEVDELPGSTIQYADIRYATNAIEVLGQTVHSPLSGEINEVEAGSAVQQLGNLLASDRAAFSIAGNMSGPADVDFFQFSVSYQNVGQPEGGNAGYAVLLDLDYADGLARANTSLNLFSGGQLILTARDSNIAEDRPGPLRGIDMQDLSRGSVGPLDPLLGTVELPSATYQVAVTTDSLVPEEMDQFITATSVNPNLRLEPIPSVGRIVEDHIGGGFFSTFEPPQVPIIIDDGFVPYHLGDVILFISQDTGFSETTISTVDGFTGALETTVGSFNRDVGDVDLRGADDRMYAFTHGANDAQAGNYVQISTGDASLTPPCGGPIDDDDVQTYHLDPANNVVQSDVGMQYDALTYAQAGLLVGDAREHGFMVGHRPNGLPTNPPGDSDNILYRFEPSIAAIDCGEATTLPPGNPDRSGADLVLGAGTNKVERGILRTDIDTGGTASTWILASEATAVDASGTTPLILDGTRFAIDHDGINTTAPIEFEFNSGPEVAFRVDPANGIHVRDGDIFQLDSAPYEFNTGPVIVVEAIRGDEINDGEVITITDSNGQPKNFEFNHVDDVISGNVKIDISSSTPQSQLVFLIMAAINGVNNYTVQAETLSPTSNRITLISDSNNTPAQSTTSKIVVEGQPGGSGGTGNLIEVEETFNDSQFSDAIVTSFNQLPAITVSPDGSRINFSGVTFGTFTEIINRGVFVDQLADGALNNPLAKPVRFLASDSATDIALKMTTALNNNGISATQDLTVIRLDPPPPPAVLQATVESVDLPLRIGGAAPGGDITGMAFIEDTLYAISDAGGLFVIENPLGIGTSAQLRYISTSAPALQGKDFQGLAAGPVATEDGLYSEILFGIDSGGKIYAFDTDGILQPLFVDGATTVQAYGLDAGNNVVPLTNVTALQFSTQEENLWHKTSIDRENDAGHGLLASYDLVRTDIPGGTSLHFGRGEGNNVDLPGGVHGSFETRTFSLANYSSADLPVLYFNYFAQTELAAGQIMFDSLRVFIASDTDSWIQVDPATGDNVEHRRGQWELLSSNNPGELQLGLNDVQEIFDFSPAQPQWRQVRVELGDYAGHDNLRLRFDYSAAGDMNTGHQQTVGDELRMRTGSELRDGEWFSIGDAGIDGRWGVAGVDDDLNGIVDDFSDRDTVNSDDGTADLTKFEIDLGYTLVAPTGKGIQNGETVTIDYGLGPNVFQFDNDPGQTVPNEISFDQEMTAGELAQSIHDAIFSTIQPPVTTGIITGSSETNDTLDSAILIDVGGLPGSFNGTGGAIGDNLTLTTLPKSDVDIFEINLGTHSRIKVDIDTEAYSNNIDLLNSVVRIFNSDGEQLAIDYDGDNGPAPGEQPGVDSYLEFLAPSSGTYYIGISGIGNDTYDPNDIDNPLRVEGSFGSYDLNVTIETSGGYVQRNHHRVQLPGAKQVTNNSGLEVEGSPGVGSGFAVTIHAGMTADAVAGVVRDSLALAFAGGNSQVIKGTDNLVRVIGHSVGEPGPMGFTDHMPGDNFGHFDGLLGNRRGQNNVFEGVYIDDIVIGLAERGEMVTGANVNTTFVTNTRTPANQITEGPYQLELRGSSEYVDAGDDGAPILTMTFDSNDRLSQQTTIVAPAGHQIADGQTFTLSDGLKDLIFEYNDIKADDGLVQQGRMPLVFDPAFTSAQIARLIRDAVNSDAVQSILDIRAANSDGTVAGESGDDRVNLFGIVRTSLIDRRLQVTNVVEDANRLRDVLIGDNSGITAINDATLVGSAVSAGTFEGGLSTIGLNGGIVLSTGDVKFAEGPNLSDTSSAMASKLGDTDLDFEFITTTLDATILEFDFETASGDLFFDFVFASEEYNESVDSQFNDDVVGVFIDGVNVPLKVPGTSTPVSISSVNGGNPIGTGAQNPQFYRNNDLNDDGEYLREFGFDGFTAVFPFEVHALAPGPHTFKLAIADVGNMNNDSAIFFGAGSFRDQAESTLPTGIDGDLFDLLGDENRHRDQGQILIHSNRITNAEEFGIVVDSSIRTGAENNLHQGPLRFLRELNTARLVPGVTITNNILASNGQGGIRFRGEVDVAGEQVSAVPFGRIVNNTIVGNGSGFGGGGVGIEVSQNAGPTILNNIVANLDIGIDVDATSESNTVLGGMLYAGNSVDFANTSLGEGDFPLHLLPGEPLFVNLLRKNFYPANQSLAIDSSIDSLEERATLNTVKQPLGIAPSPILAPNLDGAGQERVDDPTVATPSGLGQNVFRDRGAIDRADFSGPSASLKNPEDNDAAGLDRNSTVSVVELQGIRTDVFEIQLVDGVVPIDPGIGIGIDDTSVNSNSIKVFQDSTRMIVMEDYAFNYDATNDVIRLTALAGVFESDRTYRLELANVDGIVIEPEIGSLVNDGDLFQVTDNAGLTVDFEFDCGPLIQVQQSYTLVVPENGGEGIADGETFSISDDQNNEYVFELDRNGVVEQGNVAVPYTLAFSPNDVALSIVASLNNADIGLAPVNLGEGQVHVGTQDFHILDANSTSIDQVGVPASVSDGDFFTLDNGNSVLTIEFDRDGNSDTGGILIEFDSAATHEQIAVRVREAIVAAELGLATQHVGDGLVYLGGTDAIQVDTTDSNLLVIGQAGVRPGFGVRIPSQAGVPDGLLDGQTFTINDGTTTVTFEFDDDQNAVAGNVVVRFNDTSTIDGVANDLVAAIQVVGLGLDPVNAGNGIVELGSDGTHVLDLDDSVLTEVGISGLDAAVAVRFVPDESFSVDQMAVVIANAINDSDLDGVTAQARIDSVVVSGAQSIGGSGVQAMSGIRDLAGNSLEPNQPNGNTVLIVTLSAGLDYGDAPDPPYASSRANNGATHVVVDGYHLGAGVDIETDAKSNVDASGDSDDGVDFPEYFAIGRDANITVSMLDITTDRARVLDGWIDFNHDGSWSSNERVVNSEALAAGENTITVTIPDTSTVGETFARFRLSSTGTPDPYGAAVDGEVEDYQVTIGGNPWQHPSRPLDVNDDMHVSPIDALKIITALNDGKEGQLPIPPTTDFSPPPFLDVNGDGLLNAADALLVIDEFNNQSSGDGEGEQAGLTALRASTLSSQHLVMAEASYIPRLSDFIPRRQSSLVMPAGDALVDVEVDSRRVDQSLSTAIGRRRGVVSEQLDDVLQLIGEDLSDLREADAHDDYFASLRY